MFRFVRISKQSSNIHSTLTTPLLSNEIIYRNVSFKVKPAEDKVWREYRNEVWKVRQECKVENRKMVNDTCFPIPLFSHYIATRQGAWYFTLMYDIYNHGFLTL